MKKYCELCHKSIKKNDWHFEVKEINKEIVIAIKYLHKKCQDEFNDKARQFNTKGLDIAQGLMKQIKGTLSSLGIEQQEMMEIR